MSLCKGFTFAAFSDRALAVIINRHTMNKLFTIIFCLILVSAFPQNDKFLPEYKIPSQSVHVKTYKDTSIHAAKIPAIIDSIRYIYYQ
jgi:hypothetical protein